MISVFFGGRYFAGCRRRLLRGFLRRFLDRLRQSLQQLFRFVSLSERRGGLQRLFEQSPGIGQPLRIVVALADIGQNTGQIVRGLGAERAAGKR